MANRIVITLHGIRTHGPWQKGLATVLAKHDMVPYPLDYGFFSMLAFLSSCKRKAKLHWFHGQYDDICHRENIKRPSIIAHSFGTYLTAELLRNYPEVKFDKIIFTGAIVDENYEWKTRFDNGQVLHVRNDVATKDVWPGWAKKVIPRAGTSGSKGFISNLPGVEQQPYPLEHSDTFFEGHYEEWARCINKPLIAPSDAKDIQDILSIASQRTSQVLGVPAEHVRANVFIPDEQGILSIPVGASVNMDGHPDLTIQIPKGIGATGRVFTDLKSRDPYLAVFHDNWGNDVLPSNQLTKVHHELKWILSFPLFDPSDGRLFAVMNIDGLYEPYRDDSFNSELSQQLFTDLDSLSDTLAKKLCNLEHGRM
jgi:hypothetical protein